MNILILTPTDPYTIVATTQLMYNTYDQHNDLFSVQTMALLDSETEEDKKYPISNVLFAAEVRDNPRVCLSRMRKSPHLIVWGNLDSHAIKFDHIITWAQAWEDDAEKDAYLAASNERYNATLAACNIKPIRWYTKDDAHYVFPTWDHLKLFLKTLGVEENAVQ